MNLKHLNHASFYPRFYLHAHPDLLDKLGADNLKAAESHYLSVGMNEGRAPNPFFCPAFYLVSHPDLQGLFGLSNFRGALRHWLTFGFKEGRQGSSAFHWPFYLEHYTDLTESFGATGFQAAFDHWKRTGHAENRLTSSDGPRLIFEDSGFTDKSIIPILQTRYAGKPKPTIRQGLHAFDKSIRLVDSLGL